MTALAHDHTGISVNETALERLEDVAERETTEEVENRLSSRTAVRTTYFLNGLDICTIVRESGKVVEIKRGLLNHPVVDRLVEK